jgi:hypothetical protein
MNNGVGANNNSGNANNINGIASSSVENSKKDEFRRYLEKTGVMDALTKVLVGLYEEPDRTHINALDYVKKYLNAAPAAASSSSSSAAAVGVDVDGLKRDLESLKRENEELKKQVEKYKKHPSNTTTTE